MRFRYGLALPLVVLSMALAISPALAARPAPLKLNVTLPSRINGTNSACALGQTSANAAYIWFFPSDDYYYTFFNPADCQCASEAVQNFTAHWNLFFPTPCKIHVQVWILPAVAVGGGCYVPGTDPSPPDPTTGLCNSAIVELDGSAGGLIDFGVPLPATCNCLQGPFFVLFKIVDSQCPVNPDGSLASPAIVVDNTPDACISYNAYPGSGGPVDMVPGFGFPGNTTMFVEADCCLPTPTLPGSWGKIKTLYR